MLKTSPFFEIHIQVLKSMVFNMDSDQVEDSAKYANARSPSLMLKKEENLDVRNIMFNFLQNRSAVKKQKDRRDIGE